MRHAHFQHPAGYAEFCFRFAFRPAFLATFPFPWLSAFLLKQQCNRHKGIFVLWHTPCQRAYKGLGF